MCYHPNMKQQLLFRQTLGHFCTDAACAAVLTSNMDRMDRVFLFIICYNFLAFCLQPFAGIALDKCKQLTDKGYIQSAFVMLLLMLALPIFGVSVNVWLSTVIVGIANCLFHVGAGRVILAKARDKMAPLGIFVSSGSLGLMIGMLFPYFAVRLVLLLLVVALILLNLDTPLGRTSVVRAQNHWCVVAAMCACIAIRSFMGFLPVTTFSKSTGMLLLITLGVMAGKSLGGVLCDKWGIRKVVLTSTTCAVLLFLLSLGNPYLWTVVQMIVNFSMPITLYLMYKALPRYPAFSFGLAASFLVVGYVAAHGLNGIPIPPASVLILFVLNVVIILYAERKLKCEK